MLCKTRLCCILLAVPLELTVFVVIMCANGSMNNDVDAVYVDEVLCNKKAFVHSTFVLWQFGRSNLMATYALQKVEVIASSDTRQPSVRHTWWHCITVQLQ